MRLVLASASPRRARLLTGLGLQFEVRASGVPERPPAGSPPEQAVQLLAERKARAVESMLQGHAADSDEASDEMWILAADTAVILDDAWLGQPADTREAVRMLHRLSGRQHRVMTGVAVIAPEGVCHRAVEVSTVEFKVLSAEDIARYVATGEPIGKAGAYAIQGDGAQLVAALQGDRTNVVGLPVGMTVRLLEHAGFPLEVNAS